MSTHTHTFHVRLECGGELVDQDSFTQESKYVSGSIGFTDLVEPSRSGVYHLVQAFVEESTGRTVHIYACVHDH